jgi:hypothetical protein
MNVERLKMLTNCWLLCCARCQAILLTYVIISFRVFTFLGESVMNIQIREHSYVIFVVMRWFMWIEIVSVQRINREACGLLL